MSVLQIATYNLYTIGNSVLSQIKGLKGIVCGVSAGRFHTAVSTRQTIFTFGGDHGQLGECVCTRV